MTLKQLNPITPSTRHRRIVDKSHLWQGKPFKPLTQGLNKSGGRNSTGHITVRHIGGGHKRTYRLIDFKRNNKNLATVIRLEYDPNRSAFIALIKYINDNQYSYILAPQDLKLGDFINKIPLGLASTMNLKDIPIGYHLHNIEIIPSSGGKLARSAGTYGQVISKNKETVSIQLSSGEIRLLNENCQATIGKVSNPDHYNYIAGKAGITRILGRRPSVRGEAMNPVDHPHGGKTKGGKHPVTPWGKITHGKKTRNFPNKWKISK